MPRPSRIWRDRPPTEQLDPRATEKAGWRRLAAITVDGANGAADIYKVILRGPGGGETVVAEVAVLSAGLRTSTR